MGSYNLPGAYLCTLCTKGSCSGTRVPRLINKNCFGLLKELFMLFFVVAIQKRIQIGGALNLIIVEKCLIKEVNEPGIV